MDVQEPIFQRDMLEGVPPLKLDGERTLPDVPEENYWFQRHLVVYEWIAAACADRRVVDLACGEGYGSALLSSSAQSVIGVEANPDAFAHAQARYCRPNLSFERALVEDWQGDVDAVVFLQTIEHIHDPDVLLENIKALIAPDGVAFVSTPNLLTLAPEGAEKSDNPWHIREYRPHEFCELCERHFDRVEIFGLHHTRMLKFHQRAIERYGWDRIHKGLGITERFYNRFVPAISTKDFEFRRYDLDRALDFIAVLRP